MRLIPVKENMEDNREFSEHPLCSEHLQMTIDFFRKVGYKTPWISYYAKDGEVYVGSCAFKGAPREGTVEIAYGTFEPYRKRGIGAAMCKLLVELALHTDPSVRITARTLPENNFSTRILEKNGFANAGIVYDPEDGNVWEWVYQANNHPKRINIYDTV